MFNRHAGLYKQCRFRSDCSLRSAWRISLIRVYVHCLPFCVHILDALVYMVKPHCSKLRIITAMSFSDRLSFIWACTWQNQQNDLCCAPSEDLDQPGNPPSLIRVFAVRSMARWEPKPSSRRQQRRWSDRAVFAGRTVILLVWSCCSSIICGTYWYSVDEQPSKKEDCM